MIITGLISGIAVYRIQRKIDSSFAEKLEKLKADLAYSNFEQQTKFVKVYQKRIEILRDLYQKFKVFCDTLTEWVFEIIKLKEKNISVDPMEKGLIAPAKLNDFAKYFDANRHDLPDSINREINRIWESAEYWQEMVAKLLFSEHDPINARGAAYMVFRLSEELEQLYKSEADINLIDRKSQDK